MTSPGGDPPGRGSATWMAELAVLGAILAHPERRDTLHWLGAHDFAVPEHRAAHAEFDRLRADGHLRTTTPPGPAADRGQLAHNVRVVRDALHHSFPPIAIRELAEELFAAGSGELHHHVRYAQMVLEASVRRQLDTWGVRLETAAVAGDHRALHQTQEVLHEHLADLSVLVRRSQGEIIGRLDRGAVESATPVTIAPAAMAVEQAERRLLQAALTDPDHLVQPGGVALVAEDFTARHANTWRALHTVAARGDPVDPITVAWEAEAQTTAAPADSPRAEGALSASELAGLAAAPSAGPLDAAVTVVARGALARHAQTTGADLSTTAANRSTTVLDALAAARQAADKLAATTGRLAGSSPTATTSAISRALTGERGPGETHGPAAPRRPSR